MSWETEVEEIMKGWSDLGVVDTISEEETEDLQSISSLSLSPLSSPSSPDLQSAVDAWTMSTGRKPDVKIYVQGVCFHLHKDPLISESRYLKRQLVGVSEFTLSPPLKITADTFKQIADFCYSGQAVITPFNVATLRTAAELLRMNGGDGGGSDRSCVGDCLGQRVEYYFSTVVASNRDLVGAVFRSCLGLLPEAEQTGFLASRCLEALVSMDGGDEDDNGMVRCAEELKTVSPEDFRVIADSMQRRFAPNHDLLYKVVDLYFMAYTGKISEEQKAQICSCIDCSILSSSHLMHAVQNPRLPLRFIVQAMLIQQLHTHRSISSALSTATAAPSMPRLRHNIQSNESPATLGAILERDAALRQVEQLRAAIDTTSSRIQTLESELREMKQLLAESDQKHKQKRLPLLEQQPGRSSSCRFGGSNYNKVERGDRGSVSASMLRFGNGNETGPSSSSCMERRNINNRNQTQTPMAVKRNFGQKLIWGLKSAFRGSKLRDGKTDRTGSGEAALNGGVGDENGGIAMLEGFHNGDHPHQKSNSVF